MTLPGSAADAKPSTRPGSAADASSSPVKPTDEEKEVMVVIDGAQMLFTKKEALSVASRLIIAVEVLCG